MNSNHAKVKSDLPIIYISIFLLALFLRIWFNFFCAHIDAAFACDAAEYLRNAQNLSSSLQQLSQPSYWSASLKVLFNCADTHQISLVKNIFSPLEGLSISGPVFPAFILACYKLFGQSPSLDSSALPVLAQCFLSALTCVLITSIGIYCWNKKTGIATGLLAALYPAFIINSGRLYSETFACFLICIIIWLLTGYLLRHRHGFAWGFLLGVSLFALQVTRSIMGGLSICVIAFFLISGLSVLGQRKKIFSYLSAILIGFLICLLPWFALQKLVLGKTSFIVDRCGNYNLCVGNDIHTLGWLSMPYPDKNGWENTNYKKIVHQAIQKGPERWLKLLLDKPIRLFKFPWNDFKVSIGIISPSAQTIFHQFILLLAFIGLLTITSNTNERFRRPKILARLLILVIFSFHLVYLAFITVPRYALTAMPELILFAGAGTIAILYRSRLGPSLSATIRLVVLALLLMLFAHINLITLLVPIHSTDVVLNRSALYISIILKMIIVYLFFYACWQFTTRTGTRNRHANICTSIITILIALFVLPAYCLPLRAHGRCYEWSKDLQKSGTKIERIIKLTNHQAHEAITHGACLAINLSEGENLSTDYDLLINGVKLTGPFIPAIALSQDLNLAKLESPHKITVEQEAILKCLCNLCPTSLANLRQWYLIPVYTDQWPAIYKNAQSSQTKDGLTLDILIHKLTDSKGILYGASVSSSSFTIIPSLFRHSWEKAFYAAENDCALNDPAYDQIIGSSIKESVRTSNSHPMPAGAYIKLLVPAATSDTNPILSPVSVSVPTKLEYSKGKLKNDEITLSFKTPESMTNGYSLVRLIGEVQLPDTKRIVPWAVLTFYSDTKSGIRTKHSYNPPWFPNNLQLNTAYNIAKFDYCFPMLVKAFPGQLDSIDFKIRKQNNYSDSSAPINSYVFSTHDHINCHLMIYQISKLLPGLPYEIY